MNINGMAALLKDILDSQIESGTQGTLNEYRIHEALTKGPELTEEEQSILLLSPVARSDYSRIRYEVIEEIRNNLFEFDVDLEILPLAAASDENVISLKGNGFDVTLYQKDNLGIPWVILVQIGTSYREAINPMTTLRLVDSGGLEWLRGKPDVNGEITAAWSDPDTDILARSRRFTLTLEPT